MAEYITKEQAIATMEQVTRPECFIEDTRKNFVKIIEELPAADVVEVVLAHWKFYGEDGHGYGLWQCTNCGNIVPEKAAKYFCPFCGARMDGGESND